ncbi:MAG: ribonuclease [Lachnoclostridium sp.]|nr:ribonuclease [Lachnoclostridium sp.]
MESLEKADAETEAEKEDIATLPISESQTVAQTEPQSQSTVEDTETEEEAAAIDEDGHYTSKEEVALYLHTYGKLPSNFISKKEAEDLGWKKKDGEAGQLHVVAPGMSIGGSSFGNREGLLPTKKGRKYYECDINYVKGNRGAERIVYSNDGLIFYTGDHYESFEQLYP